MQNITAVRKGNVLTLTVDLSKRIKPSASGKTIIVASTEGNARVEGDEGLQFGLNVYARAPNPPRG